MGSHSLSSNRPFELRTVASLVSVSSPVEDDASCYWLTLVLGGHQPATAAVNVTDLAQTAGMAQTH